jgi:hypothetical protein
MPSKSIGLSCALNTVVLIFAAQTPAAEIHVPSDFTTIQAALDASLDGDEIILAPGVYTGAGNRDMSYLGKAVTISSTDPSDPAVVAATVIDCQGTAEDPHRAFVFENNESRDSILAGGEASGSATIRRCTIANNLGSSNSRAITSFGPSTVEHTIIRHPGEQGIFAENMIVSYSNIEGGLKWLEAYKGKVVIGAGLMDVDPQFVMQGAFEDGEIIAGDYHLLADSPMINAGDPGILSSGVGVVDIDGQPRVLYGRLDIGADEYLMFGDCDADGDVDLADFAAFQLAFSGAM